MSEDPDREYRYRQSLRAEYVKKRNVSYSNAIFFVLMGLGALSFVAHGLITGHIEILLLMVPVAVAYILFARSWILRSRSVTREHYVPPVRAEHLPDRERLLRSHSAQETKQDALLRPSTSASSGTEANQLLRPGSNDTTV